MSFSLAELIACLYVVQILQAGRKLRERRYFMRNPHLYNGDTGSGKCSFIIEDDEIDDPRREIWGGF